MIAIIYIKKKREINSFIEYYKYNEYKNSIFESKKICPQEIQELLSK